MRWDQHFLISKNIAEKIVNSLDINSSDTVIEIGPGRGILTQFLVKKTKNIIVIEIDRDIVNYLKNKFENLKVICADFLKYDINKLHLPSPFKFIGNLPFSVGNRIIEKIMHYDNWDVAIFMVQKEVGERITACCGSKKYGLLSIIVQNFSTAKKIFIVKRSCFKPFPKVDAMVIKLMRKMPVVGLNNWSSFLKFVNKIFQMRRKKIVNILNKQFNIKKNYVNETLNKLNIDSSSRPEKLEIEKLFEISKIIEN